MTAAFILTKTGRDALYFMGRGLFDLPKAYIGIAVLSLPMALSVIATMRSAGPRRTRVIVCLCVTALLVAFHITARPGGGILMTAFFMCIPLSFGVLFSMGWLLVAELNEDADRVRLVRAYSIVGAASILGGIVGAAAAGILAQFLPSKALILAGAGCVLLAAGVVVRAHRMFPGTRTAARRVPGPTAADYASVLRDGYSRRLMIIAVAASVAGIFVEFQFYLAAAISGQNERGNASFFAGFYFLFNLLALILQLTIMPRLQKRAGVHGSLLVLPGALLLGVGSLIGGATLLTRSILRVVEGGLKSSIHRANWEQAYVPLGPSRRAAAKIMIDGMGARFGEGLAAGVVYVWLTVGMVDRAPEKHSIVWVIWTLFAIALVWIAVTLGLQGRACRLPSSDESLNPEIPLPDA